MVKPAIGASCAYNVLCTMISCDCMHLLTAGMPANIALLRASLCANPRLAKTVALFGLGKSQLHVAARTCCRTLVGLRCIMLTLPDMALPTLFHCGTGMLVPLVLYHADTLQVIAGGHVAGKGCKAPEVTLFTQCACRCPFECMISAA